MGRAELEQCEGKHAPDRLVADFAGSGPARAGRHRSADEGGEATGIHRAVGPSPVGVLFMVPFVLTALVFMVYPIVEAVRMAFYSYNPLRPDLTAASSASNFAYIFDDPLFWTSFWQADGLDGLLDRLSDRFGVAIALLASPGAAGYHHLPRPAAVPVHRADGRDRPHLALDLQSGDRRGELRAAGAAA